MRASFLPHSCAGPRGPAPVRILLLQGAGLVLVALLTAGCGEVESPGERPVGTPPDRVVETVVDEDVERGTWHERSFVFVSADTDSVVALPWSFHTRQIGGREVRFLRHRQP